MVTGPVGGQDVEDTLQVKRFNMGLGPSHRHQHLRCSWLPPFGPAAPPGTLPATDKLTLVTKIYQSPLLFPAELGMVLFFLPPPPNPPTDGEGLSGEHWGA